MGHASIDYRCLLVGALFGIGIANGQAHWKMIRTILMAWLLTLPTAAILSAATFILLRSFTSV